MTSPTNVTAAAGSVTLSGGPGSDTLNGTASNDLLIYNVSQNSGSTQDLYTGGAGTDTVRIDFTLQEWLLQSNQAQISAYLAHLATFAKATKGGVSNGYASDFTFTFGTSTLKVQMMEKLIVTVDGAYLDPADAACEARNDDGITVTEDSGAITINVLGNDSVPDLVQSVAMESGPSHGTATLVKPNLSNPSTWYFDYTVDQAAAQSLAQGESWIDSFSYLVMDADGDTSSATVSITITGSNDAAVISGDVGATVTEDGPLTASGDLLSTDVDNAADAFQQIAGTANYGSYSMDAAGVWTYALDNANSAVQALDTKSSLLDSFDVRSEDGTLQTVNITIQGMSENHAAVITGASAGTVVEASGVNNAIAGTPTATGTLSCTDVDEGENVFMVVAAGTASDATYGTFEMTAAGTWTYSLNNANAAVQALNVGGVLFDSFTVNTVDGTAQTVNLTINGANDAAIITPTEITANFQPFPNMSSFYYVTLDLVSTDVDNAGGFQVLSSVSATYGTYWVTSDNAFSYYSYDMSSPLPDGTTDQCTVYSVDGTAQTIEVLLIGSAV